MDRITKKEREKSLSFLLQKLNYATILHSIDKRIVGSFLNMGDA